MRLFFGLAVFAIAATAGQPAQAGAYCAVYTDGAVNCDFPSIWACRAAVFGVGGNCGINPRAYVHAREYYAHKPHGRRAYRHAAPPCRVYLGFGRWTDCD